MDYLNKIAEELGISRSSVYRAIKHMKPMSAEMRNTVINYIKTNYPEKLAKISASAENIDTKHIAVIMPYKPEYFWEEAANGMQAAVDEFKDCCIELKFIYYAGSITESEILSLLTSVEVSGADALCIVPANTEKVAQRINEIAQKIPVAILNEGCHGATPFLSIVSDGYAEGQAIGCMVKEKCPVGSHVVVVRTGSCASNIIKDRMRGLQDSLQKAQRDGEKYYIESVTVENDQEYNYHTIMPSLMARMVNACIEDIEAKGGHVKAAYALSGVLLPLFIALRKMNRQEIAVFGHEINANALSFFKNGIRGGYVRQDIYEQGYAVINALANKVLYDKTIYPAVYNTRFDSNNY